MFARFNENPAMTLQDIKETKRYRRTDGRTDGRTDNVKTVYPLQTKFVGGIIKIRRWVISFIHFFLLFLLMLLFRLNPYMPNGISQYCQKAGSISDSRVVG